MLPILVSICTLLRPTRHHAPGPGITKQRPDAPIQRSRGPEAAVSMLQLKTDSNTKSICLPSPCDYCVWQDNLYPHVHSLLSFWNDCLCLLECRHFEWTVSVSEWTMWKLTASRAFEQPEWPPGDSSWEAPVLSSWSHWSRQRRDSGSSLGSEKYFKEMQR